MKTLRTVKSNNLILITALTAVILLYTSSIVGAAYISQKITGYSAFDLEKSADLYSDLEYELTFEHRFNKGQLYFKPKLKFDSAKEELELDLYEGYLDLFFQDADLRLGRQIITWGKADGLTVINLINDQHRGIHPIVDPDDSFIASDALKLDYYTAGGTWEAIFSLPPEASNLNSDRSGYGFRYSALGMGFDYEITAGSFPQYNLMLDSYNRITGNSEFVYRDQNFIGGSFSNDLGSFVLKGEGAYFFDRDYLQQTDQGPQIVENDELEVLLGIDFYPGDYLISLQAKEGFLIDEPDNLRRDKSIGEYSLMIQRSFWRDNLSVENWLIYREMPTLPGMENTLLWRPRLTYDFSDRLTFAAGVDHVIEGSKRSEIFYQLEYIF
ncbi:hypothetical protein [Halanaerobium sp. ST460_2HS_T2]|uniref:hypothetical protein n=1 Tax=Halanaerobium sp. ST460_2HS_T2 TaxID=2183914 RepID=UPI000DF3BB30|nr:hypothetical protein [Halanaerobium sp. ST460_2HS_T2]RCW56235.1 hypothetical protein DFR80_11538 [Halanaerobium sp. ST460_2HS_T2]